MPIKYQMKNLVKFFINMNRVRVIPVLLLDNDGLYKTKNFKNQVYIGDPINAVKIFNEKEVDELIFIDFTATTDNRELNYTFIEEIVSEAFMPICYGGGIKTIGQCEKLFTLGIEKVCLNYSAVNEPTLIKEVAKRYGSSSTVVSIDVKKNLFGIQHIYNLRGIERVKYDIVDFAKSMEDFGAGELLITSIDKEGTQKGYDIDLIKKVSEAVSIPVVAHGGAANLSDMVYAVKDGRASAVAAGAMFVFWGNLNGILINFPSQETLNNEFFAKL